MIIYIDHREITHIIGAAPTLFENDFFYVAYISTISNLLFLTNFYVWHYPAQPSNLCAITDIIYCMIC